MNYNPTKQLKIAKAVKIGEDPALGVDIRMLTAAIQSQLIGQSFSTVVGALMNCLQTCANGYPDVKMRQGIATMLRNIAVRTHPELGGWVIEHSGGGKWRTLDSLGLPEWTNAPDAAMCFRNKEHAELMGMDDPEDVRIRPAPLLGPPEKEKPESAN